MGLVTIFRTFGLTLILLGAAMSAPLIVELTMGGDQVGNYLFSAAMTMFFGVGLVIMSGERRAPTDLRSALLVVLLWWSVAPLFAAMPFMLDGASFVSAYFEAVSAVTTTGAWLSTADAIADPTGLVWRALLQWLGGLASLAIAAGIFIRPVFVGIDTLLPPFSRGERSSYIHAMRNALRAFFGVYVLLTLVCFVCLMLADAPLIDAAIMALSAIASGGIVPHEAGLDGYSRTVAGLLLPFVILSGANFVLIARLLQGSHRRIRDVETGAYAAAVFCVSILFWVVAGAGDLDLIPAQFMNAASLLSTSGFTVGEAPPLPVALVTVLIGGCAVSTAGGFKILRWLVIIRRAREEIRKLVTPSAVFGPSNIGNELGVWMHFLVFTFVLGVLVLMVTAGGHSFQLAIAASAGVLANVGPVLSLAEGGEGGYGIFGDYLKIVLIVGMILGRLEGVAALALLNRAFWRT